MKQLIVILLVVAALYGGWELWNYWKQVEATNAAAGPQPSQEAGVDSGADPNAAMPPGALPGLPPQYEPTLAAAQKGGVIALGNWLKTYRRVCRDPRLAQIELDYVVLLTRDDPVEAKRVFEEVRRRVRPNSPVYERVKRLEKNYL
jgi:hypothetical protein